MGTGQPPPQCKHRPGRSCTTGQGQALAGTRAAPPNLPWCPLSRQRWPGLAWGCGTTLLWWSNPWLRSPGMHCLGQGESRGRPQLGWRGHRAGGHCPTLLQLQSSPAAPTLTHSQGTGTGKCSLPDHNAYVGKEGGKGEEEEYIPSRTVNHAE